MSTFDAELFAQAVLYEAAVLLDKQVGARLELAELRKDIEATLAALEVERNGRRARALRDDLAAFLPGRCEAIVAAIRDQSLGEIKNVHDALILAQRATTIVAKAFVTSGGL